MTAEEDLARLADGPPDAGAAVRISKALAASARTAGAGAVASGRWLAETLIDLAPRIKVRDLPTLREHYGGLEGSALAGELIRNAGRAAAVVGATTGALMSVEEFAPPAWISLPFELLFETLAVAAIELKLVAELHEAYGMRIEGSGGAKTSALVRAWAERRGVTAMKVAAGGGLAEALGRGTRNELVKLVRRRLMSRAGRNLSSLAPFLAGAVAGAEVNRRATLSLGQAVVRDLAERD